MHKSNVHIVVEVKLNLVSVWEFPGSFGNRGWALKSQREMRNL